MPQNFGAYYVNNRGAVKDSVSHTSRSMRARLESLILGSKSKRTKTESSTRTLNVLWLIDHVCYDGSLHGGGRLFMEVIPSFDPQRVRIFPYFLRSSPEVRKVFEVSGHPVQTLGLGKYDPRTLLHIARLCDEHDIDVMHLFCYASSTFGRVIGKVKGIPTIIHDFDTQVYFPYPFYLRVLDRLLAGSTGKGLAPSAMCRDYMRDTRGVPGNRLEILPHAIAPRQLQMRDQIDRVAARRSLDLGTDFLFAAVTKLGPERGNEALLTAFSQARRRVPHVKLAIIYKPTRYHRLPRGYEDLDWVRDPGAMVQRTNDLIMSLGLGDSVILAEAFDHAELYYQASDVLVAPFESIRFSSASLVDAMAYGRPHIVTDIGEPAELVDRYQSGIKVPIGDITQLADAMVELASNPQRLAMLSENARLAARDLRAEAAAERMTRIYETLVPGEAGLVNSKVSLGLQGAAPTTENPWWHSELLEHTNDAIIIWEMEGAGILYWNQAAEQLYGYSRKEAQGRVTHDLLRTISRKSVKELESMLARYGVWVGELSHTTRDGRNLEVEGRLSLMSQRNGRWLVLEVNRDITDRKRAEVMGAAREVSLSSLNLTR